MENLPSEVLAVVLSLCSLGDVLAVAGVSRTLRSKVELSLTEIFKALTTSTFDSLTANRLECGVPLSSVENESRVDQWRTVSPTFADFQDRFLLRQALRERTGYLSLDHLVTLTQMLAEDSGRNAVFLLRGKGSDSSQSDGIQEKGAIQQPTYSRVADQVLRVIWIHWSHDSLAAVAGSEQQKVDELQDPSAYEATRRSQDLLGASLGLLVLAYTVQIPTSRVISKLFFDASVLARVKRRGSSTALEKLLAASLAAVHVCQRRRLYHPAQARPPAMLHPTRRQISSSNELLPIPRLSRLVNARLNARLPQQIASLTGAYRDGDIGSTRTLARTHPNYFIHLKSDGCSHHSRVITPISSSLDATVTPDLGRAINFSEYMLTGYIRESLSTVPHLLLGAWRGFYQYHLGDRRMDPAMTFHISICKGQRSFSALANEISASRWLLKGRGQDGNGDFTLNGYMYLDGTLTIEKQCGTQHWQYDGMLLPYCVAGVWGNADRAPEGTFLWWKESL
ncbi:hypothetical protein HDU93_006485 [Gonapodya sp. JEL0774]|nr:hypothetical protein HDU93_006485 [Gonapodya sp. JEL0774]